VCYSNHGQFFSRRQGAAFLRIHLLLSADFTSEPVFGIIKAVMGFRSFLLRGYEAVKGEWNLVCMAFNIKKLHALIR